MKKEKDKIIPLKNYVYVVIMFLLVGVLVFVLRAWYRNYKEYKLQTPVISGQIQEIDINEIKEYITEHDDFFIYIGVAKDENCRELESDLVPVLNGRNIKSDTIYLNMSNISNDKEMLKEKLSILGYNYNSASYPMFLIVRDKKIMSAVYRNNNIISIGDIEQILDENEIGE